MYYIVHRPLNPCFLLLQSALAPLQQVLPQEVPGGCQIGAFLLAGDHPGVPQHAHHIIRALQPTHVADTSAGYEEHVHVKVQKTKKRKRTFRFSLF